MITRTFSILAAMMLLISVNASATVHYVDLNCTNPVSPYTDWSTASKNIQSAINVSISGDLVMVTNGVYQNSYVSFTDTNNNYSWDSQMVISNGVTVASVNGPSVTIVQGLDNITCACLEGSAQLSGFTLTNGHAGQFGGGVYCTSTNALITNCVICSNNAFYGGGGVYQGTLNNCIISNNVTTYYGGASYGSALNHCIVIGNTESAVGNQILTGASFGGTLNNCLIISNSGYGTICYSNVMNNCLILSNAAPQTIRASTLRSCTLCFNSVAESNPIVALCNARNCILYYNQYYRGQVEYRNYSNDLQFCCLEPQTIFTPAVYGTNNFTNAPLFLNLSNDFHLQPSSPCINAGNNAYVSSTNDYDGNPRIVGGTVDIGAYEFQSPQSIISYSWLQQYGLPTDGSADLTDPDGDGMNNWQEWKSGTVPTNATSRLQMLFTSNNVSGTTVTWQSVSGVTYFLQSSSNLGAQPSFSTIQSNLTGQASTTSYTDTTATNGGAYFYRVGVQ